MVTVIKTTVARVDYRLEGLVGWKVPEVTRTDLRRFLHELALGKVNRGRRISEERQVKYLDLLRAPLEFIKKPIASISEADIERFERALSTNLVRSRKTNCSYSDNTKVDMRKALKIFLRWRLGQAATLQMAGWLDTRPKPRTPDFLREADIELLYQKCRLPEQRYMMALLFDSGARAQEFLNIRLEDVQVPDAAANFVRIAFKEEYSKTKGRTISLYWRHSVDAVRQYLDERTAQGIRPSDPVFAGTYGSMRMFLSRMGRRVLARRVHPHLLRHSSATYYATRLNRQELCYRYGWRFSSNMPDIYISRSGMETHQLDAKFTQTELSTLKNDFVRVNQDNQIKSQRIEELQKSVEAMRRNMELITELLAGNPRVEDIEASIRRKRVQPR